MQKYTKHITWCYQLFEVSAGKINFSETLPRSRRKFERTSTRSKLAKTSKYSAWIFWIFEELSWSLWVSGSLTYCFSLYRKWNETYSYNDRKLMMDCRFHGLSICRRWNAFFLFSERFFFCLRKRRKLLLPTVLKTRQNFKRYTVQLFVTYKKNQQPISGE